MSANNAQLDLPDPLHNASGKVRTVGFELEFSGVTLEDTVRVVCRQFSGTVGESTAAEVSVDTQHGSFTAEVDWDFLKRTAAQAQDAEDEWLERLSKAAAILVPIEVVCPPIPMTSIHVLGGLVQSLRHAGAVGTEESLIAAYGVHINTEIPALDAATVDRYLRAFCLLQWWLAEESDLDIARRISPYIDLFDEAYIRVLLSREKPDIETLIGDYLEHNATRNRALDMLPLFAHIDSERVRETIDDPKIKARPTFHYRLPNCRIDDPQWSLANSWNLWCLVEKLANDDASLARLGSEFIDAQRPLLGVDRSAWVETMSQWCDRRA
jgi:hypothetical protein